MVMEKSWNMRNLQNVRESCDQSELLPILSLNFTKCVTFLQTFRKLATVKKVNVFSRMPHQANYYSVGNNNSGSKYMFI